MGVQRGMLGQRHRAGARNQRVDGQPRPVAALELGRELRPEAQRLAEVNLGEQGHARHRARGQRHALGGDAAQAAERGQAAATAAPCGRSRCCCRLPRRWRRGLA